MSINKIVSGLVFTAAAASVLLGAGGCGHKTLKVATVNTERIIAENPKYMELKVVLADERKQLYSQIPTDVRKMSGAEKKALQEKLQKEAAERSKKFDKLYRDSISKLQEDIKGNAEAVCSDKKIDLVVVDTMNYPVVLYSSGDNITLDILLKMDSIKTESK
ncbi:hypothetical protein IJT93_12770 [bacterium]|nr:hypothetical protein [bacterium]